MSVEKEIKELSKLYTETTKRYREIKREHVDEEIQMEHAVLEDIKNYLNELLKVLPKPVTVFCCGRLTIHLLKNEYYESSEGQNMQTDVIIIGDADVYEECMALDNKSVGIKFCSFEHTPTQLNLKTLEIMCEEWKEIKKSIYQQTIEELDSFIKERMKQIKEKKDKLHYFKDWEV